ncbi:MAG: PAS domain S-box protein [Desulfobacterales bacterium]|jgi:PAS domain S-box-containing protein|nr:PAS domain S-box protein [Desulfobacterales bacterium]
MKTHFIGRDRIPDSMVLAVVLVSTVYWVLDSILNIFFSNKFNLIAQLIGPDLYDIYIRVVVLCLLVILGSHGQTIINRLREAQQKLKESEELWRSLVETAPDTIMTVDQAGVIRFINHPLAEMPPGSVIGRCLYDLLPEDYRGTAQEIVKNVFRTGETDMFEVRMDGQRSPAWYTYRVGPLRMEHRVIAATIISTNTTEFKRAEELSRYKELFENVADSVFILNRNGVVMECNDRVYESTGFTQPELVSRPLADLAVPDQSDFVRAMLQGVLREKEARFELTVKAKSGGVVPYEISCRYVVYLGEPCFLCVARDVTQTQLLHNQLIRSERLAATGQLAASIAHEINSPLQGITALLNVLRSTYTEDDYLQRKLDLVKSAFNSIRDTVKNLIDLNRPGKEKKQLTDANQVINNTVALVKSLLKKNMITVRMDLAATRSTLFASPQQIGQVLMNLINNAVESITGAPGYFESAHLTPGGGGRLVVQTYNRDEQWVLELKDSGPGIPEEDLNRIFDPFFTKKKPLGMGVGLTICHGIIEDHQGKLTASNAPDGGALFTIALPLRPDNHPTDSREDASSASAGQPA